MNGSSLQLEFGSFSTESIVMLNFQYDKTASLNSKGNVALHLRSGIDIWTVFYDAEIGFILNPALTVGKRHWLEIGSSFRYYPFNEAEKYWITTPITFGYMYILRKHALRAFFAPYSDIGLLDYPLKAQRFYPKTGFNLLNLNFYPISESE